MTERRRIRAVRGRLDAAAVRALVGSQSTEAVDRLYYPYYWYRATARCGTLIGVRSLRVDCAVDARTGTAATADAPEVHNVTAAEAAVLGPGIGERDAGREAERFLRHELNRRLRTLMNFRLGVEPDGLVHWPYWLVDDRRGRLLIDGVSGGCHPLADAPRPTTRRDR